MDIKTIAESKYLGLYAKDNWYFADRPNCTGVIGVLPILEDGRLILVEQYRIPVQANVIEIPAGLVGDEEEFLDESLAECAARELLEETGYRAKEMTALISSPTSAGMTPEMTHLFAATKLTRETSGGGTEGENITVHHILFNELQEWLEQQESNGKLIDFKIHSCLYLASVKGLLKD